MQENKKIDIELLNLIDKLERRVRMLEERVMRIEEDKRNNYEIIKRNMGL